MKFYIERASARPIGDAYTLLGEWSNEYDSYFGVIEIHSLEDLPQECFVMQRAWEMFDDSKTIMLNSGYTPDDIAGRIILYDDYLE